MLKAPGSHSDFLNGQLQEVAGVDSDFSFGHTELEVYPSRGVRNSSFPIKYNLGNRAYFPHCIVSIPPFFPSLTWSQSPQSLLLLGAAHLEPISVCLDYSDFVPSSLWEALRRGYLQFSWVGDHPLEVGLGWLLGPWIIPDPSQVFVPLPQFPPT